MNGALKMRAIVCVCLAIPGALVLRASGQEFSSSVHDPATAFLTDAEEEAKRGTYVLYTQAYKDVHKDKVALHGSVYGVLRDVKVTGCDLEAKVEIFDLFSGFVSGRPAGERQDLTEYSIRFRITPELAADVFQARPSQLAHSMHTQCDQDSSCEFNWLRIRFAKPQIQEQIVLNHSVTFDGKVREVLAPVSSKDAGNQFVRDLRDIAGSECK